VLNPKSVAATSQSAQPEDESFDLPELTPSLEAFSQLPLHAYEKSWDFIKQHRDVVVSGASDALLVAAFTAESEGKSKYAKQCVHQSLLLQYGDKLGKDGLKLFFQRYVSWLPLLSALTHARLG
jgi:cell division cycle protein 37